MGLNEVQIKFEFYKVQIWKEKNEFNIPMYNMHNEIYLTIIAI